MKRRSELQNDVLQNQRYNMILSQFSDLHRYDSLNPLFKKAFDWISSTDFSSLTLGKHEIAGADLFSNVQEYETRPVSESFFEAHRKFIDIQFLIDGEEYIGYCPKSELIIDDGYDEQKDLGFGEGIVDFIKLSFVLSPVSEFMLK